MESAMKFDKPSRPISRKIWVYEFSEPFCLRRHRIFRKCMKNLLHLKDRCSLKGRNTEIIMKNKGILRSEMYE